MANELKFSPRLDKSRDASSHGAAAHEDKPRDENESAKIDVNAKLDTKTKRSTKTSASDGTNPRIKPKQEHWHGHRSRLREKFRENGDETLSDYELLELLLFRSQSRRDVKPIAKELLSQFGSVREILAAPPALLRTVQGIGEASVDDIKLAFSLAKKMSSDELRDTKVLSSFDEVIKYCKISMAYQQIEVVKVIYLNNRHEILRDEISSSGTIDRTAIYPREVVKRALELGASSIILVHNHPSGDPLPSNADISITRSLARTVEGVGVELYDHLIVGRDGHTSLRQLGLIG